MANKLYEKLRSEGAIVTAFYSLVVLLVFFITGCYGPSSVSEEQSIGPYRLVWSDEFDYTWLPDPAKWGYDVGAHGWGNKELQDYTSGRKENARVENGRLIIEARQDDSANQLRRSFDSLAIAV